MTCPSCKLNKSTDFGDCDDCLGIIRYRVFDYLLNRLSDTGDVDYNTAIRLLFGTIGEW